jgi:hypothetical protein
MSEALRLCTAGPRSRIAIRSKAFQSLRDGTTHGSYRCTGPLQFGALRIPDGAGPFPVAVTIQGAAGWTGLGRDRSPQWQRP